MPKPRTDRFCVRIDLCLENDINEAIEQYQAELRLKGEKLQKRVAAERYFALTHKYFKEKTKQ